MADCGCGCGGIRNNLHHQVNHHHTTTSYEYESYSTRPARSYTRSCSTISYACGRSLTRVPQFSRNVFRDKTPPPVIERHIERVPTPEPDVIERVIIKPQPQRIHELVIERPKTPPPVVIEKEVLEEAPETKYTCEVKDVENSGRNYAATVKLVPATSGCSGSASASSHTPRAIGYTGYTSSYNSSYSSGYGSGNYQGYPSYYEYLKAKYARKY